MEAGSECELQNRTPIPDYLQNYSVFEVADMEITIFNLQHYLYDIILPAICAFGIIGNILNIIIFLKKRRQKLRAAMENSTMLCLVALAISDLLFCIITLPMAFVQQKDFYFRSEFILYYNAYGLAFISMFIMSSTLLTVTTAVIRYLAICHPFRSQKFITTKVTMSVILVVIFISIALNAPRFWYFTLQKDLCTNGNNTKIQLVRSELFHNDEFVYAYKIIWAIVGNFLPLVILLYCNIHLIIALRQSDLLHCSYSCDDSSSLSAHRKITISLVIIILFFFVFVSPSEITTFMMYVTDQGSIKPQYRIASLITNFLQSINFSVNFILYYIIIAQFRKDLHEFMCRFVRETESNVINKQSIMLMSMNHQEI